MARDQRVDGTWGMEQHSEKHPTHIGYDGFAWPRTFDARAWARSFADRVQAHPELATDEGFLLGWFANTIMRGFDEGRTRQHSRVEDTVRVTASEAVYGFASWLSCRSKGMMVGCAHDCTEVGNAADKWLRANELPGVRACYPHNLTVPENSNGPRWWLGRSEGGNA